MGGSGLGPSRSPGRRGQPGSGVRSDPTHPGEASERHEPRSIARGRHPGRPKPRRTPPERHLTERAPHCARPAPHPAKPNQHSARPNLRPTQATLHPAQHLTEPAPHPAHRSRPAPSAAPSPPPPPPAPTTAPGHDARAPCTRSTTSGPPLGTWPARTPAPTRPSARAPPPGPRPTPPRTGHNKARPALRTRRSGWGSADRAVSSAHRQCHDRHRQFRTPGRHPPE
jgi:WAS/WASL-interacting protein